MLGKRGLGKKKFEAERKIGIDRVCRRLNAQPIPPKRRTQCLDQCPFILASLFKTAKSQPAAVLMSEQGFAVANDTTLPIYSFLAQDPTRAKRFSNTMSMASPSSLTFLASAPIWQSIGPSATVVDVGGSRGHVSAFLAQNFSSPRFVVQDLPATTAEIGPATAYRLPENVKERVTLMEHDFFEPQPVREADVYLFRFVFHNWSDEYCLKILRALVPAMGPGTKVVVNDHCMPEPGALGLLRERRIR